MQHEAAEIAVQLAWMRSQALPATPWGRMQRSAHLLLPIRRAGAACIANWRDATRRATELAGALRCLPACRRRPRSDRILTYRIRISHSDP